MKKINEDFDVPFYVFDEILKYNRDNNSSRNYNRAIYSVNIAKLNGRFTEAQANFLKDNYIKKVHK